MPASHRFFVSPRHDPGHGHAVDAASFEEAAAAFVERWSPPVDHDGDVALIVYDQDNGRQLCLRLDLDKGETEPCA
jgi:hypothetical protein